jgi:Flp pilus assembly protein TadG
VSSVRRKEASDVKKRAFFPAARLARREDGAVLVVVALTMAVLLGFSALVIDMGALYLEKSRLQSALDAAALAGAQELPDTAGAASAARKYYAANGCDAAGLSVTFPDAETITCSGEQTVQTTFARVLGVERTSTRLLHATAIKTK